MILSSDLHHFDLNQQPSRANWTYGHKGNALGPTTLGSPHSKIKLLKIEQLLFKKLALIVQTWTIIVQIEQFLSQVCPFWTIIVPFLNNFFRVHSHNIKSSMNRAQINEKFPFSWYPKASQSTPDNPKTMLIDPCQIWKTT